MMTRMDSQLEKMKACSGKTKPMDLEANPEEKETAAEQQGSLRKGLQWRLLEH
jgi:hypothetical protein